MSRIINCKKCKKPKYITSARFRRLYEESNIADMSIFKSEYVCRKCRTAEQRLSPDTNRDIKDTYRYRIMRNYLSVLYRRALKQRFTPEAVLEMRTGMHAKLALMGVRDYEYIVCAGVLRGLRIKNIPLFGDVDVSFL